MTKGNVFNDVFQPMYEFPVIKEEMPGIETTMLFVKAENKHSLGEVYSLTIRRKCVKSLCIHFYRST